MGDRHNLFGRVNEIHLFTDDEDPEDFYIEEVIPGDTIEKVLGRVQYEANDIFRRVKNALDQRVKDGAIRPKDGVAQADYYEAVMRGYTYLAGPQAAEAPSTNGNSPSLTPGPTPSPVLAP